MIGKTLFSLASKVLEENRKIRNSVIGAGRAFDPDPLSLACNKIAVLPPESFDDGFRKDSTNLMRDRVSGERRVSEAYLSRVRYG